MKTLIRLIPIMGIYYVLNYDQQWYEKNKTKFVIYQVVAIWILAIIIGSLLYTEYTNYKNSKQ